MWRSRMLTGVFGFCLVLGAVSASMAQKGPAGPAAAPATGPFAPKPVPPVLVNPTISTAERKLFVPLDELDVLVEKTGRGVLLPRKEFETLHAKAKAKIEGSPVLTRAYALTSSAYKGKVDGDQLVLEGELKVRQFAKDWQAIPLEFEGVAVEKAEWDGQPARLGRDRTAKNRLILLTDGEGDHTLKLRLSAPLSLVGSDSVTVFRLPQVPAGTLDIELPAKKHLYLDEVALERAVAGDTSKPGPATTPAAGATVGYHVPLGGQTRTSLRLSERGTQKSANSLVFASTAIGVHVMPEELTWRAAATVQVFGKPIDSVEFTVPKTLEITSVESTGLDRWEIESPDGEAVHRIRLHYRQAFGESRGVTLQGVSTHPTGMPWQVPSLAMKNAVSQLSRIRVQSAPGLRLQALTSQGARRVTGDDLTDIVIPGMPTTIDPLQLSDYVAWEPSFVLEFRTAAKARELQATVATRLAVDPTELSLASLMLVKTRFAPLFEVTVSVPAEWTVLDVLANGQKTDWQALPQAAGTHHLRIPLKTPIAADHQVELQLRARLVPGEKWPIESETLLVNLPEVAVLDAGVSEGKYTIVGDDDLEMTTLDVAGLELSQEKVAAPAAGAVTRPQLVYDYQDSKLAGKLQVNRKPTTISAHTVAMHRLEQRRTFSVLETRLAITGGGARRVKALVPDYVTADLHFQVISGDVRIVEQHPAPAENGLRGWLLQFDQRAFGVVTLALQVQAPRDAKEAIAKLPDLRFAEADRQTGFVAVEAEPDQHLTLKAVDGALAPLHEIDPPDMPLPTNYIPKNRIVGAYRFVRPGVTVTASERRFDRIDVPTAVVESLELASVLGESGEFQHRADFTFKAVGVQALSLTLPPGSLLWGAVVDGKPVEVRRTRTAANGDKTKGAASQSFQVALPVGAAADVCRQLQVFYRNQATKLSGSGQLEQPAPQLVAIAGDGATFALPVLQQNWTLHHPWQVSVLGTGGQFEPTTPPVVNSLMGQLRRNLLVVRPQQLLSKLLTVIVLVAVVLIVTYALLRHGWMGGFVAASFLLIAGCVGLVPVLSLSSHKMAATATKAYIYTGEPQVAAGGEAVVDESVALARDADTDDSRPMSRPVAKSAAVKAAPPVNRYEVAGSIKKSTRELGEVEHFKREIPRPDRGDVSKKFDDFIPATKAPEGGKDGAKLKPEPETESKASDKPMRPMSPMPNAAGDPFAERPSFARPSEGKGEGKGAGVNGIPPEAVPAPVATTAPATVAAPAPKPSDGDPKTELMAKQLDDLATGKKLREDVAEVRGVVVDEKEKATGTWGGLMSLALQLVQPTGHTTTSFRYTGSVEQHASARLSVAYQLSTNRNVFVDAIAIGLVVMFWFLRRRPWSVRLPLVIGGLFVPFACAPLAPLGSLVYLDALFLGTLYGGLLWLALFAMEGMKGCCAWCQAKRLPTATGAAVLLLTLCGGFDGMPGARVAFAQQQQVPAATKPGLPAVATPANASTELTPSPVPPPIVDPVPPPIVSAKPTLVVPYDVTQKPEHAERVFLPFDEFLKLYRAANESALETKPIPANSLISELLVSAKPTSAGTAADVTFRFVIHTFADGQTRIAIPLGAIPLQKAELNGKKAVVVVENANPLSAYSTLIDTKGTHVLDLAAQLPIERTGPAGRLVLPLRASPTGSVRFELPTADLQLRVNGITRAYRLVKEGAKSVAVIPLAATGELALAWAPEQSRDGADQVVLGDASTYVALTDAGVRLQAVYRLQVKQGALSDLTFAAPEPWLLRKIDGADVGGWELTGSGADRKLKVVLRRSVNDATTVQVDFFQPQTFTPQPATLAVPQVYPLGLTRETGTVAVFSERQLSVSLGQQAGLTQLTDQEFKPAAELPPPGLAPHWTFRYAVRPFQLSVLASRLKSQSRGIAEHGAVLTHRKLSLSSRLEVQLVGAPRSQLRIDVPAGYTLFELQSNDVADYFFDENEGDDPKGPRTLLVQLGSPRTGNIVIGLKGTLTREAGDVTQSLPVPRVADLTETVSTLAVRVTDAFAANVKTSEGWNSIEPNGLPAWLRAGQPQFLFSTRADEPNAVALALKPAVSQLQAQSLTSVIARETVVDYVLSLQWQITQAAEQRFVFTTPEALAGRLDFSGNQGGVRIRQVTTEKAGTGRTRWTLHLEEPQRDRFFATARFSLSAPVGRVDTPRLDFEPTQAVKAPGPQGAPGVSLPNQQHYVLLLNQTGSATRLADPQTAEKVEWPSVPIQVGAELKERATALVKVKDAKQPVAWVLETAQQVRLLAANVNLADTVIAIARDGSWRSLTEFRVMNRARQFLAVELPQKGTVLSLFVDDFPSRPVTTKRGEKTVLLIPLPKTGVGDLSSVVKLVVSGRIPRTLPLGFHLFQHEVDIPTVRVISATEDPEMGMPVTRTAVTVHLPNDYHVAAVEQTDRTNMVLSDEGADRLIAEYDEALNLWNDLNSSKSLNDLQKGRALNNLKQLGQSLRTGNMNRHGYRFDNNRDQQVQLEALGRQFDAIEQQVEGTVNEVARRGIERRTQVRVNDLESQLQVANPVSPTDGKENGRATEQYFDFGSVVGVTPGRRAGRNSQVEDRKQLRGELARQQSFLNNYGNTANMPATSGGGMGPGQGQPNAGFRLPPMPGNTTNPTGAPVLSNNTNLNFGGNKKFQVQEELEVAQQAATNLGDVRQKQRLAIANNSLNYNDAPVSNTPQLQTPQGQPQAFSYDAHDLAIADFANPFQTATAGGLSLTMRIPTDGQKITYTRVGGDPKLTLALRTQSAWRFGFDLLWTALWLALAVVAVLAAMHSQALPMARKFGPTALIAIGLFWYIALPAALVGLALFLIGLLTLAWQSRQWGWV